MSESQRLAALGERLRAVDPLMPSPAAKIRGWNLVAASIERSSAVRSRTHSVRRLVLATVAVAVLLVAGTVAASADSLPDSPFYPVKGALEQARGLLAFSPSDKLTYHLELARTRLAEAEAMIARHRVDLASQALNGLNEQLAEAAQLVQSEQQTDPAVAADLQNRLQQAIATHDQQLAGLQGQVSNPTAQSAIATARDRAAAALRAAQTPTPAGNGGANGQGSGKGPSAKPTPKH
ncbi:MAG TPA: DUF5667 domain-containing protein [Candidatus Dormibacteraeota bacterium]|nr:DUF5667 domain-containing protein [Candidatus Dormibacteraeota bacterium]